MKKMDIYMMTDIRAVTPVSVLRARQHSQIW